VSLLGRPNNLDMPRHRGDDAIKSSLYGSLPQRREVERDTELRDSIDAYRLD